MSEWAKVQPDRLRDWGLLWAINEAVLWPLGIALGARLTGDEPPYEVLMLTSAETIIDGIEDVSSEPLGLHPRDRLKAFIQTRLAQMNEEERGLATVRLGKLWEVFSGD